MATYSPSNRMNAAISQTMVAGSSYTAPANGFAHVNLIGLNTGTGGGNILVNGVAVANWTSPRGFFGLAWTVGEVGDLIFSLVLGPGQSLSIPGAGHGAGTSWQLTGAEFLNT